MGKEDKGVYVEPREDIQTTSKRLKDQLRRGLVYSRRRSNQDGIDHTDIDCYEPRLLANDVLAYFRAFSRYSSSLAPFTLKDAAERSSKRGSIGKEYSWFSIPFDQFEYVPAVVRMPNIDWKVYYSSEAERVRFRPGLIARVRQMGCGDDGNNERRVAIARYYLEVAGGIYGDRSRLGYVEPTFEQLLVADYLHRRGQDLQLTVAYQLYLKYCHLYKKNPFDELDPEDSVAQRLRNMLYREMSRIDGLLVEAAGTAWIGHILKNEPIETEQRISYQLVEYFLQKQQAIMRAQNQQPIDRETEEAWVQILRS